MSNKENDKHLLERLNLSRRSFLKTSAVGSAALAAGGLVELKTAKEAKAFAYEPIQRITSWRQLSPAALITAVRGTCWLRIRKGMLLSGSHQMMAAIKETGITEKILISSHN